jgi:hypothetical protein
MQEITLLRRAAQVLWWSGLALLAAGLALLLLRVRFPIGILFGLGSIAVGANALLGGEIITGPEPRSFTARGPVVRGQVEVKAGLSSFTLGTCGSDRIATMRYGPFGEPNFDVREGIAYLQFTNSWRYPNFTRWQADLANNVLWAVEARCGLGDLELDLGDLRIDHLYARTTLGHLTVLCPHRGYAEMHLQTGLGQIEVHIPPEVGARLTVKRGPLSTLAIQNDRLLMLDREHYATSDFDTAPAQVEVYAETSAGDLFFS